MDEFPYIRELLPELEIFFTSLAEDVYTEEISAWPEFESIVTGFFSPARIDQIEAVIPGWKRMASFADGATLIHVSSALVALFIIPEFHKAPPRLQELTKWSVLLHDLAKEVISGRRDHTHGFRSAAVTARILPLIGFKSSIAFAGLIETWESQTSSAIRVREDMQVYVQDNSKLSILLNGIDQLFGDQSQATFIVKSVLLHMSINAVKEWPQVSPLSDAEIRRYFDTTLLELVELVMLADSDAWSLFDKGLKEKQHREIAATFKTLRSQ